VNVDNSRCIACGACIDACRHDVRDYNDDTERFLNDLRSGVQISLFMAPANRTYGENWGGLLTWLRQKGVRKIYDVSLGADICTWAHLRFIQKENPKSVITQPCPAIVNYILMHKNELLPYLSPVHSPMLCTAIYMNKYMGITDKIAALSPCIAKACEFDATKYVQYNVTFKKLYEYIQREGIRLPGEHTGFDHADTSLGALFSMPGGLKENVEQYLGKKIRIDKSEGSNIVYHALDEFVEKRGQHLPAIFDVLNCAEGCNLGTGCVHDRDIFEINEIMDNVRQNVLKTHEQVDFEAIFEDYDKTLSLNDFIRRYTPMPVRPYFATEAQIEHAFEQLHKHNEIDRMFDCVACGCDTCHIMAKRVACGINIPQNCIQKERVELHTEHNMVLDMSATNLENINEILDDISQIRGLSGDIVNSINGVNDAINKYSKMASEIDAIARHINIISLNASIEAARAGQHGKAFAVVAEEVRKLAQTSKNTVSETESVTEQATSSISVINTMIKQIGTEIEKAYVNISNISNMTNETLAKEELQSLNETHQLEERAM